MESGFFRTQVGSQTTTSIGDLLLRFGVSNDFEFRIIGLSYGLAPGANEGLLDPSIGFKYRLLDTNGELTFVGQTTVPIGASALRANEWNATAKLAYTRPVGDCTVGGNLAYSQIGSGGGRFGQFAVSAFVSKPLNARASLTPEIWFVDRISRGGPAATFVSLAGTYLVGNDTQLDLRIGTGLHQARDGWFLQGGVSVRF